MLNFSFSKPDEVVSLLGERLRNERLVQQMTQSEVASRAGIGVNTLSNLEAGKNVGIESMIRVAMVLGRIKEIEALFLPKLENIDDIMRYEKGAGRQRIRKGSHND